MPLRPSSSHSATTSESASSLQPSSSREAPSNPTPKDSPSPPRGFRAHLHHLLPRHALFRAQIDIHQISSVPLVRGHFAVRWKLKHCVAAPGAKAGLFKLSRESSGANGSQVNLSEIPKDHVDDLDRDDASISSSISPDRSSSIISSSDDPSVPTVVVSEEGSSGSAPQHTQARGQTAFLPLHEHSVVWSHSLSLHLKIPLSRDRETPDSLMPSPAKFVVTQRVVSGDPDAPKNPRLGAVYLDLSEYAGGSVGEVTRRYLLRDSKTNTTLKLMISLTHVGGEKHYVAPPLPKGEILNGLTGLLENDIYRTRPRGFDVHGRYIDDLQEEPDSDPETRLLPAKASAPRPLAPLTSPFDVTRLPLNYGYGPKTTETLIEALFNPVPLPNNLRSEGHDNPFVRYIPEQEGMTSHG